MSATQTIEIAVDEDAAMAYEQASPQDRRKLDVLLNLRLRELVIAPHRSLREVMDLIGTDAKSRGLTPDMVALIVRDK